MGILDRLLFEKKTLKCSPDTRKIIGPQVSEETKSDILEKSLGLYLLCIKLLHSK